MCEMFIFSSDWGYAASMFWLRELDTPAVHSLVHPRVRNTVIPNIAFELSY